MNQKDQNLNFAEIKKFFKSKNHHLINKKIIKMVSGGKILDLGCNIGYFSYALAKIYHHATVIGTDSSGYMIKEAEKLYKNIPNLSFKVTNALNLEFNDNEFDCVCLLQVIEHLDNPYKALHEIHRILKPDGSLVLATNNVYYSRFFIRQVIYEFLKIKPKLMIFDPYKKWDRHIFVWDISTLCTLLKISGFDYLCHFYVGSSGFYLGGSLLDKYIDTIFGKIFPFFRALVVVKLKKRKNGF